MKAVAGCATAVFLLVSGCTGSLLQSKAPRQINYVMTAQSRESLSGTGQISAPLAVDLSILKPQLSPGLETDRILLRYPDRRLDYFAGARWAGTLDDVVQDLAVQIFRQRGELRSVNSESSRFTNQYWLAIEVEDFQAEYTEPDSAPMVRVRLNARLGSADDHHSLGTFEVMVTAPAAGNRLGLIVAAYEHAANDALGQIAAQAVMTLSKLTAEGR